MISIFIYIVASGVAVQCMSLRWCEVYNISNFNHLIAAGAIECFFEIKEIIKIYRKKNN